MHPGIAVSYMLDEELGLYSCVMWYN